MVRESKPRAGSLAFYPRKRARRIYPRVTSWPSSEKVKVLGFAGYKVGMGQAKILDTEKNSPTYGQEIVVPVTILEIPPLKVVGIRAYEITPQGLKILGEVWDPKVKEDKYVKRKVKVGRVDFEKNVKKIEESLERVSSVRLIVATQPHKAGIGKKTPEIFEIEVGGDAKEAWNFAREKLGKELSADEVFQNGELVDVIAVTKGKGTQGPVKRFGVKIQTRKAKKKRRHVGSLGSETPQRVLWTVPQAGQMGFQTRTELNKRILKIGSDIENVIPKGGFIRYGVLKSAYLLLEGSVPGPKKRLIRLRKAIRPTGPLTIPVEIREVITEGS
ncbi:MAG: 50S ribosomal protein L3 [Candidatus Aenigmarchaeota archaeon]|nr:50S ribosomal protein L3 [Candidatus Aenigmarchaeota archaeon]